MMGMHQSNPFWRTFFEGDAGGGGGTGDPAASKNDPPPGDPASTPASGGNNGDPAIVAAYEKLRAAESERDQLKAQLRSTMPEAERIKAERDDLKKETDRLKQELANTQIRHRASELAANAGFRAPSVAIDLLMYRKVDLSSDEKINKALNDLAQEDAGLVGQAPPSGGPVNPANGTTSVGSRGFNQAIRAAAGRPAG